MTKKEEENFPFWGLKFGVIGSTSKKTEVEPPSFKLCQAQLNTERLGLYLASKNFTRLYFWLFSSDIYFVRSV